MTMTLTERLENLLQRQIEWFEEALAWYENLAHEMGVEAYDELLTHLEEHGKAIDAFTREREILEKEMRVGGAATLPASLKPLAATATALAHELNRLQAQAAERATDAAHLIQDELGTLQRGRSVLDGYRTEKSDGVQWLDRKG